MNPNLSDQSCRVYKVECADGCRYIIYNASEIGNPGDHVPDKWYFRPYPIPLGLETGLSFDTAEMTEEAARAQHIRVHGTPSLA